MKIVDILKQLAETSSSNARIEILKEHSGRAFLKSIFKLAYDSRLVFHTREIKVEGTGDGILENFTLAFDALFIRLSQGDLTGNAAKEAISNLAEKLTQEDFNVIKMILKRDLKCGVSAKTANKIWPGLCMEYPCLLANKDNEKNRKAIHFPAIVETKYDGMRINMHVDYNEQTVYCKSRNGKAVDCVTEAVKAQVLNSIDLSNEFFIEPFVLDGELLYMKDGRVVDRKTGNGFANKAIRGTVLDEEKENFIFNFWDIIPSKYFWEKKYILPLEVRNKKLQGFACRINSGLIMAAPQHIANDWDHINQLFKLALDDGEEGIMVKNIDGIWENRRSKDLLKLKAELDDEFKIIDVEEGTGRNAGRLGAFKCISFDNDIEFNVGTGFSDLQRNMYYDKKYIGRTVTIKYNEVIQDKVTGINSLFLPVFVEVREDK